MRFGLLGHCAPKETHVYSSAFVCIEIRYELRIVGFRFIFNGDHGGGRSSMERSIGKLSTVVIVICVVGLIGAVDVFAAKKRGKSKYKTVDVSNGATLSGAVTLKGKAPAPKTFPIGNFPQGEFCSGVDTKDGTRILRDVSVGKGNALQDVVVVIKGIKEGKARVLKKTHVDMDVCKFLVAGGSSTFVGVVSPTVDFTVTNKDEAPDPKSGKVIGVLHNPHSFGIAPKKNPSTMFNLGMPEKGQTLSFKKDMKKIRRAPVMKLQCDQHEYMQAWFRSVRHPYYALVGADGTFSIDQIPAGKYKVIAWHPILGEQTQEMTFGAGAKESVKFEFAGK